MQKLLAADKVKVYAVLTIATLILVGIIWYCTKAIQDKYYLSREARYSIMTGIGKTVDGKGHTFTVYNFIVNSKKYSGTGDGSYNRDKTYSVKFFPPDPSRNRAVLIEATSYDIENLPANGYEKLPHH